MTRIHPLAAVLAILLAAPAQALVAEPYEPEEAAATLTWWDARILPLSADPRTAFAERIAADHAYIRGMRPHHAGALTMSEAYLRDPEARNPALRALARAIIVNQEFEIALLDDVARLLEQPVAVTELGVVRLAARPVGTEGLGQRWRFIKAPIPALNYVGGEVTERDARFAKAMTIHHQAAVEMARDYDRSPHGRNNFVRLLNVDIVTDQTQEIALMRNVLRAFPGGADAVRVDPSEIHGMEGHAGHGGAGHGAAHGHRGAHEHAQHGHLHQGHAGHRHPEPGPHGQHHGHAQHGHEHHGRAGHHPASTPRIGRQAGHAHRPPAGTARHHH